jgi:stress-induced morphogen
MMSETSGDTVVDGMIKKLEKEFSPVKLEVIPAYGDPNGSHVTISIVSKTFEGKRAVQRQQLVYKVCCICVPPCMVLCVTVCTVRFAPRWCAAATSEKRQRFVSRGHSVQSHLRRCVQTRFRTLEG